MCHWTDFRVITLLPMVGKVLERIILNRLLADDKAHQRLFCYQHGFTKAHSCQTALFNLVDSLQTTMSRGLHTAAIFFDIAGTFDTVPHNTLMNVIRRANYPPALCRILQSYLTDRLTCFTLHHTTLTIATQRGTPQGGVLSPYLWNVYINTLLQRDWGGHGIKIQAYADDVVV